ncbi:MAG: hypothetical protein ACNA8W_11770 [Bradymonadaceae bacterium]
MFPSVQTHIIALLAVFCLLQAGCGLEDLDLGGGSGVSGTVHGADFSMSSGTAEYDAEGNYFITLSDSALFDCFSAPTGNHLSIIVAGIGGEGTFSASGTVSFNSFEHSVNNSENALSGTVRVESIDAEVEKLIRGSITASGPESEVSGSFRVKICD